MATATLKPPVNTSGGYTTEVDYGRVFSSELTPNFLNYVALINCISPIPLESGFNYCDLGCGNGVTPTVLAAANPQGKFYGIDFNPIHIENAQELAVAGKVENVSFLHNSFAELEDLLLPEFHFIAVHAVYAWISPENRQHLLNFIHRHLVPGGLVYLDYNCLPGMGILAPINKIMREYALAQPQPPLEQVKAAVLFGEQLLGADSAYVQSSPFLSSQISGFKERPLNALAHEFLNENWTPSYSIDVARHLATAELSYVGSSIIVENGDEAATRRLNQAIAARSLKANQLEVLASPVAGTGIYVHPSVLLVLHLVAQGGWENLPERIWEEYQKRGISLNVGGKQVIQGKTEAIATLRQELESFIPRHRYYLEYFGFTDSSFFESEEKPLTSIPP
jgi:SAM-dependent methyltransferase